MPNQPHATNARSSAGTFAEGARGEEGIACKTDCALHAAFLIAARHRHRAWLEAVVGGQLEQPRMEADRIAHALEHGAL
jgi:hypothetical protein